MCSLIAERGDELEYDLMTMTPYVLEDLGGALPWRALLAFARNLPPSSATARASSRRAQEAGMWADPAASPQLLAALIDELRAFEWQWARAHGGRNVKRPRPIPRPGVRDGRRRYGSGAVPVSDFNKWWSEAR